MTKIYISIAGGCLTSVLSTSPDIEVEIWDWDNIKEDAGEQHLKRLEKEWSKLAKTLTVVA